ncbi:MAG: DNA polymerase III subunit alpha [Actinobacteria bacterium]|nr:DNA polymerase III subunit alpha [Actinomycetota bacterium]
MAAAPYVELHAHSAFSFLDGASIPSDLAEAAAALGYPAMALTDHDGVWGSMEFATCAKSLGLRPITGAELTVRLPNGVDGPKARHVGKFSAHQPGWPAHLTLLVEDDDGYRNLCRLLTAAHAHTRDNPARAAEPAWTTLEEVERHAEGLVCLSGCARDGALAGAFERGDTAFGERLARRLLAAFGRDRFRVELQRPYWRRDHARNRWLALVAERLGVATVATGNVHAHTRSRSHLQDALVAVGLNETLESSEPRRRGNSSSALASPAAMATRFAEHPDAVAETVRLAERLRFDLTTDLGYSYPQEENADARLATLCRDRLVEAYPPGPDRREAEGRLGRELATIRKIGLSAFFLLHHRLLELARDVALEIRGKEAARSLLPPGRGRGSSVSSIVCYLTGLSHIDPVKADLFPGRFLNEEIVSDDARSMPDIDLDFPRDIREVLIPRVHEAYGADRSALVAAFPTYRPRGVVRDLGKALGLPPEEVEKVAGVVGFHDSGAEMERDVVAVLGEKRARSCRWQALLEVGKEALGLPRHASQHSGGMVISTAPLVDFCPLVPTAMERRQIVQWDKDSCADAGLLKIDLLGLGMLSAVERCVDEVKAAEGETIDLSRISLTDEKTFRSIQRAETTGVFQIESRAQMQMLPRTHPETLEDLTVQVALVRPGPIQGGAVHPYIERRKRRREDPDWPIPYEHPSLEKPLKDTLGTIVYQEQVLEVAMEFAGFTAAQAEGLRRAMSRKRSEEEIEKHHRAFVAGARRESGASAELAEEIWEKIQGFAGFGFPKAHSAAFGLLAYQSAWLREHHPEAFLCGLLNEQPMGFYPPDALVHEAARRKVRLGGVDANRSHVLCHVESPLRRGEPPGTPGGLVVRIGLDYVKGVRKEEMEALVAERERGGPYRGIAELASRSGVGLPSLEKLAWAGALDEVPLGAEEERRRALWRVGVTGNGRKAGRGVTQLALPIEPAEPPRLERLGDWGEVIADYRSTGMALGHHPMALMRPDLAAELPRSVDLERIDSGAMVEVAGMVVARQRPETARGIVFMLIEDEVGVVNLIVPARVYDRNRVVVRAAPLIRAEGKLERREGVVNVLVARIAELEREPGAAPAAAPPGASSVSGLPTSPARGVRREPRPGAARRRDREFAVAELREVAPAGHMFGRRG